jgi:hypothetical protein
MSHMGVDQYHQSIGESRVLDRGVLAEACCLLCPLQHTVCLMEVDLQSSGETTPALWNAASTVGLQHDLQQVHHVGVVDLLCNLGQQTVLPNVVEVAPQINVLC